MKYVKLLIFICLISSCAVKVPFTTELQKKYSFSEETLKKVQFYTSDEIVLTKSKQQNEVDITRGNLILSDKEDQEIIRFKKNTPCLIEKELNSYKFVLSFEQGDNRTLLFGSNSDGYYSIMAKEWLEEGGILKYADKMYLTQNKEVYLKVKIRKLNKLKNRERTVSGKRI